MAFPSTRAALRAGCLVLPALIAPSLPVQAQSTVPTETAGARPGFFDLVNLQTVSTALFNTLMSSARVLADIRYGQISADPLAMRLTLLDLDVRPLVHGDPNGCILTAERATLAGQPLDRPDQTRVHVALDEVSVSLGCLPPEGRAMAFGLGVPQIDLPRLDLTLQYDPASGGGSAQVTADLNRVAAFEARVEADYISFRLDPATEEPVFAVDLRAATLTVDDRGAWDLARRVMPPELQEPEALRQIVTGAVTEMLTTPGASDLTDVQRSFAQQAGDVAAAVGGGARRVVLATNIDGAPLRLDEARMAQTGPLFEALAPSLTLQDPVLTRVLPVAMVKAALDSEDELPENALTIGRALLTGVGTPRNRNSGLTLLAKASRAGNAEAALLVAEELAESDPETAYGHAMRAAEAGQPGALAVLDRAEAGTSFAVMIETQDDATPGGPDAALYASVLDMRRAARAYQTGIGRYRSYRAAYYWATMAAAAGDASGAAIRDEIDQMMRLRGDAAAWAEQTRTLEAGVLRDWIAEDLPARLQ